MALNPCPVCEKDDTIRKVSGLLAEQTSLNEATGVTSASFGRKFVTEISGLEQSQLAINLSEERNTASSMHLPIGVLGLVCVVGSFFLIRPLQLSTTVSLLGLTLLVTGAILSYWGFTSHKKSSGARIQEKNVVEAHNARVKSAWYCSRCDVRFDSAGDF